MLLLVLMSLLMLMWRVSLSQVAAKTTNNSNNDEKLIKLCCCWCCSYDDNNDVDDDSSAIVSRKSEAMAFVRSTLHLSFNKANAFVVEANRFCISEFSKQITTHTQPVSLTHNFILMFVRWNPGRTHEKQFSILNCSLVAGWTLSSISFLPIFLFISFCFSVIPIDRFNVGCWSLLDWREN